MKTETLLKDPVFQLNLLIWMAKEQPPAGYRVKPLFYNWGFRTIYIEQPFPFPEETFRVIKSSGLDIGVEPEPELILGKENDNKALYFEAKANSFGVESANSRQARSHLVATGRVFGEVFAPLDSCLLCYVVPDARRDLMSDCLSTLTDELKNKGLTPGPFSTHGLAVYNNQIIYSWDASFKNHLGGINKDAEPIIDNVGGDMDPVPLVLVYSDEDCADDAKRDFYRRVVIEQVCASLLCDLHSHPLGNPYQITAESLLLKTTDTIFQYLGRERQKGLRRLVRENVFKKIGGFWEKKQDVKCNNDQLIINWRTADEKKEFLNWLEDRRVHFDAIRPPKESPTLFDHL